MSFQSLIAHNGVTHQKSNSVEKLQPSTTETTNLKPKIDAQIVKPESNNSSKKQTVENSEIEVNTEKPIEAEASIETPITANLANATLVTGFGESIFTLLIVSPFLLLGFKKWLHR